MMHLRPFSGFPSDFIGDLRHGVGESSTARASSGIAPGMDRPSTIDLFPVFCIEGGTCAGLRPRPVTLTP
jgi:hypothetical protein